MFVLVTGPPAAGKTTLSAGLAEVLGLPRFAKDTIKRGLLEALGADGVEASRRIGAAAVEALLAVAAENAGGVLDSVWVRPDAVQRLRALPGPVVEVFCACDLDELRRRYARRAEGASGARTTSTGSVRTASSGTSGRCARWRAAGPSSRSTRAPPWTCSGWPQPCAPRPRRRSPDVGAPG